jgi:hypothetical protein
VKYYNLRSNPAQTAGNMGSEKRQEMLFWTREEYAKFAAAMMDKPRSFYALPLQPTQPAVCSHWKQNISFAMVEFLLLFAESIIAQIRVLCMLEIQHENIG